jgi:hypothetical protein
VETIGVDRLFEYRKFPERRQKPRKAEEESVTNGRRAIVVGDRLDKRIERATAGRARKVGGNEECSGGTFDSVGRHPSTNRCRIICIRIVDEALESARRYGKENCVDSVSREKIAGLRREKMLPHSLVIEHGKWLTQQIVRFPKETQGKRRRSNKTDNFLAWVNGRITVTM